MSVEDHKTIVTSGLQSEHCVVHSFSNEHTSSGSSYNSRLLHYFTMGTNVCLGSVLELNSGWQRCLSLSDLASASAKGTLGLGTPLNDRDKQAQRWDR